MMRDEHWLGEEVEALRAEVKQLREQSSVLVLVDALAEIGRLKTEVEKLTGALTTCRELREYDRELIEQLRRRKNHER
jgi:hypothetical protein